MNKVLTWVHCYTSLDSTVQMWNKMVWWGQVKNCMRKEIKDHESSKMHSSNRFSVCKGITLKRWENYGLERWILYYKWRKELYWRVPWLQTAKICLVPVSAYKILCLCFVILPEEVQAALRDLAFPFTHCYCFLQVHTAECLPPQAPSAVHCWLQRKDLTARVVATSVISTLVRDSTMFLLQV